MAEKTAIVWFRRDLRLNDNPALSNALNLGMKVLPIFIFDQNILEELNSDDSRVSFIHQCLSNINEQLAELGTGLHCYVGKPLEIWRQITTQVKPNAVFFNRDYEPYGRQRDEQVQQLLESAGIAVVNSKDHVIFEPHEILKKDGKPYSVFTPYKKQWLSRISQNAVLQKTTELKPEHFIPGKSKIIGLHTIGFKKSDIKAPEIKYENISNYDRTRDIPSVDGTSYLGPHLRFGTVSIREIINNYGNSNETFISELIWREFFIQILWHFPATVAENYRTKYNTINWRNKHAEFEAWCQGKTGFALVDAGMRQLVQTGYMHNRVRMLTAAFLCKHLLTDWRWGEAFFARHLLDFEHASNTGNWQWAAGTGCDAAPYFRIFNPDIQAKKFDPESTYVKKWVPEYGTDQYPPKIIEHSAARTRALKTYKSALTPSS